MAYGDKLDWVIDNLGNIVPQFRGASLPPNSGNLILPSGSSGASFPLLAPDGSAAAPSYSFANFPNTGLRDGGSAQVWIVANGVDQARFVNTFGLLLPTALNFESTIGAGVDLSLFRDAADTLAQRRGVNPQTFRLYNTFTDASNYERLAFAWSGNTLQITTQSAGTGAARDISFFTSGAAALYFGTSGISRWQISATGHLFGFVDNTYDIGGSGAARPRNIYVGSTVFTTAPTSQGSAAYTVLATDNTIRNSVAATLTLPAVASSAGRKLRVVTLGANAIISSASNVVPITGGAAGTAILAATAGKWADLECDGSNWIITAAN